MKISEVASKKSLSKDLNKLRQQSNGIRMLNAYELEYVMDKYGEDNMRVYICPECGHKDADHWAEDSCPSCNAPSQFA